MGLFDEATIDGCDVQMQANHLSHFLLTLDLWPLLEKAAELRGEARVVNHSSGARKKPWKPISADYLQKNGGNLGGDRWPGLQKWQRYQQSKLANILFTYALQTHAEKQGSRVKSLCAHPGPTFSGLQQKTTAAGGVTMLDNYILNGVYKNCHSTEDGAMGIVRCCCETSVESGQFYGPAVPGNPGPAELLPDERAELGGEEAQKLLWEESAKTTGAMV
jgi:NAD(P)-dependent dehydrogenase (short-subunit alcohol dehydrogenase family)